MVPPWLAMQLSQLQVHLGQKQKVIIPTPLIRAIETIVYRRFTELEIKIHFCVLNTIRYILGLSERFLIFPDCLNLNSLFLIGSVIITAINNKTNTFRFAWFLFFSTCWQLHFVLLLSIRYSNLLATIFTPKINTMYVIIIIRFQGLKLILIVLYC